MKARRNRGSKAHAISRDRNKVAAETRRSTQARHTPPPTDPKGRSRTNPTDPLHRT